MSEFNILIDMDGVLVDFVGGISKSLGLPFPYKDNNSMGKRDLAALWEISEEAFWSPCRDVEFWSSLSWTDDGKDILSAAEAAVGRENVYILSDPSSTPEVFSGKAYWVEKNIPHYLPRLMLARNKSLLATSRNILIDDRDENILEFHLAGGHAVQVPRLWNAYWPIADVALKHVIEGIDSCTN